MVLPDGNVLLGHGLNRGLASVGDPVLDYERREGLRFHMCDPETFALTPLARTTVSRGPSRHCHAAAGWLGVFCGRES